MDITLHKKARSSAVPGAGEASSRERPCVATLGRGSALIEMGAPRTCIAGIRRSLPGSAHHGSGQDSQNKSTGSIWRDRSSTVLAPIPAEPRSSTGATPVLPNNQPRTQVSL